MQDNSEISIRTAKARKILRSLYPEVKPQLHFRTPFELLLATILSSQCTKWSDFSLRLIFFGRETCTRAQAEVFRLSPRPSLFLSGQDYYSSIIGPKSSFKVILSY